MAKLPTPGLHDGKWGEMLNEYLTHEHREDGTHNTKAMLGIPATGGQLPVSDPKAPQGLRWRPLVLSVTVPLLSPVAGTVVAWRAPTQARITAVHACRTGGIGATINARKRGGQNHLATDLSLSVVDSWLDGGIIQQATYETGDTLLVVIAAVSGSPTQLTIQVDVELL